MSLVEGSPGVPGDGVIIRDDGEFPFFDIQPGFSLRGVTNGITISVFPGVPIFHLPNTGNFNIGLQINFGVEGKPLTQCSIGSSAPEVLTPTVNGVQGIAGIFSQSRLNALVDQVRRSPLPGCEAVSLDQFFIHNILMHVPFGHDHIHQVDALAIGIGENVFPTKDTLKERPAPTCAAPNNERFNKTRVELIREALPYAELSNGIYGCPGNACKYYKDNPPGWSVLDEEGGTGCIPNPLSTDKSCSGDGFHAVAYRHDSTGKIVAAFEGTTLTSIKDWKNNLAFLRDNFPPQYEHAITFTRRVVEKYGTDCEKPITVTGHSLGGGMAQYVALQHGLRAYVFNSAGSWAPTIEKLDPKAGLRAYIVRFEGQEYFRNGESGALDWVSEEGQKFEKEHLLIPIKTWKIFGNLNRFHIIHKMENLLQGMEDEVQNLAGKTVKGLPLNPNTKYKKEASTTNSKTKKDTSAGCNKESNVLELNTGGAQGELKKYGVGKDGC
ncbi:MAG: Mbeg1-like protein [Gammaproteobacteria bacterium]